MRIPDANTDVPPFAFGVCVPLPGITWAKASLVSTTPAVASPPVTIAQATLTYTDAALPADSGHLLQSSSYGQQTIVGTITTTGDSTQHCSTFSIPSGALALGYLITAGNFSNVSGLGIQSNFLYFSVAPTAVGGFNTFPYSGYDSTVKFCATDSGAASTVVFLAFTYTANVQIQQVPGTYVKTKLFDANNNEIGTDTVGANISLLVSNAKATAAPWQAPNQLPVTFSGNIAASPSFTSLVAASGTKHIYLFDIIWTTDSTVIGGYSLFFNNGTQNIAVLRGSEESGSAQFNGVDLGASAQLQVQNDSGATKFYDLTIVYSQT